MMGEKMKWANGAKAAIRARQQPRQTDQVSNGIRTEGGNGRIREEKTKRRQ